MSSWQMHCVVAQASNRVIGDGQRLLWHLPGDLPRVKALTMGCALIMGRRTYWIDRPALAWARLNRDDQSRLAG